METHIENNRDDGRDQEVWIIQFQNNLKVEVRAADPGNIPGCGDVTFYHGDPLECLSWGGQFKALVHDTKMPSKAMMSFLQTKVSKDYDQVIACLLPDDEGYAEALMSSISEDITSNGYRRSRQRSSKVPIIY